MKAITVRRLPATRFKPDRLVAEDMDGNRVTISQDIDAQKEQRDGGERAAANALCRKMGWHGQLARGEIEAGSVFVFAAEHNTRHTGQRISFDLCPHCQHYRIALDPIDTGSVTSEARCLKCGCVWIMYFTISSIGITHRPPAPQKGDAC